MIQFCYPALYALDAVFRHASAFTATSPWRTALPHGEKLAELSNRRIGRIEARVAAWLDATTSDAAVFVVGFRWKPAVLKQRPVVRNHRTGADWSIYPAGFPGRRFWVRNRAAGEAAPDEAAPVLDDDRARDVLAVQRLYS